MSAPAEPGGELEPTHSETDVDVNNPDTPRFDMVREGARRDGVQIVVYEPRYPGGSRLERRVERSVAGIFLLAGLMGVAFLVIYAAWPWQGDAENGDSAAAGLYTPLLGITLGLTLLLLGLGIVAWVTKLMPHEVSVEQRHDDPSDDEDRKLMTASLGSVLDDSRVTRRPLLAGALTLGLLPVGAIAAAPIVGGLIRDPHDPNPQTGLPQHQFTGFHPALNGGEPVRLVLQDGTPLRPADVSIAGQMTVFPGIPGGATNEYADSPTLLIHLRQNDADALRSVLYEDNQGNMVGNFVAYSKVCTHAGCPPSLFEQQSNRLLCPCHQSQFQITDNARPVFGPAARSLPMLPLALDDEGYFVAAEDYRVPVGPSYWER